VVIDACKEFIGKCVHVLSIYSVKINLLINKSVNQSIMTSMHC